MLFTLKHLFVTLGLLMAGLLLLLPAAHEMSETFAWPKAISFCVAIFVACGPTVLLSWPLYKMLHLRPLNLPVCPGCGHRHGNYHIPPEAWPTAVLICGHCKTPLRLLLTRQIPRASPLDIPTVNLQWPEFLGIWRHA